MALGFPETDEHPHFHLRAFRVRKKIFATLDETRHRVMVKLGREDQSVFCAYDRSVMYPVPGGWGLKGATYIELKKIRKTMFRDALTCAYCQAAPVKLAAGYRNKRG